MVACFFCHSYVHVFLVFSGVPDAFYRLHNLDEVLKGDKRAKPWPKMV